MLLPQFVLCRILDNLPVAMVKMRKACVPVCFSVSVPISVPVSTASHRYVHYSCLSVSVFAAAVVIPAVPGMGHGHLPTTVLLHRPHLKVRSSCMYV